MKKLFLIVEVFMLIVCGVCVAGDRWDRAAAFIGIAILARLEAEYIK